MKNRYMNCFILLSIIATVITNCMENPLKNFQNIFLNNIENKTGKNLNLFIEGKKKITPDILPKKLKLYPRGPAAIGNYYTMVDIRYPNNPTLFPFIRVEKFGADELRAILYYRTAIDTSISSSEVTHTDVKINPEDHIYISVILEGDKLEKSKFEINKKHQPKSLKEQSAKSLAKLIKENKLSLEQAKKTLPEDLHEALDEELAKLK